MRKGACRVYLVSPFFMLNREKFVEVVEEKVEMLRPLLNNLNPSQQSQQFHLRSRRKYSNCPESVAAESNV